MDRGQIIERIRQTSNGHLNNIKNVTEHIKMMDDTDNMIFAEELLAVGACIIDSLNNISLILCELLPKEDEHA